MCSNTVSSFYREAEYIYIYILIYFFKLEENKKVGEFQEKKYILTQ